MADNFLDDDASGALLDDLVDDVIKVDKKEEVKQTDSKQNVIISKDPFVKVEKFEDTADTLPLPSDFNNKVKESIKDTPNLKLNDTEKTRIWAQLLRDGMDVATFEAMFKKTLENPDALFEQEVPASEGTLAASYPKFKAVDNQSLKGERAVMRLMAHQGLGAIFRVPLWHTGIWLTFKAPSEGALLELHRQISSDKITLGRSSYGLAFANTSSYMTDRLVNFALEHMYQSSLNTTKDLKEVISSHDIPTIVWGLACSIWSNGFQYQRACSNDPEKCQHVVQEKLNLTKLLWTNTKGLSKWQVAHMSSVRNNSMSEDSVLKYKQEMLNAQNRAITLKSNTDKPIKLVLKVPTINEYVDSGNRWIGDIVDVVTKALGTNASNNERDNYILDRGRATTMRQYTHWVHSMEFDSNLIEDNETLEQVLDLLSSDDDVRNEFMTEVDTYINDSAISVIGVPAFECPKCGMEQTGDEKSNFKNIIPIDVYQSFFILLVQKLQKIRMR